MTKIRKGPKFKNDPNSGTVYEFEGRGYIAYYRSSDAQGNIAKKEEMPKKRKQKTPKVDNPRENTRS